MFFLGVLFWLQCPSVSLKRLQQSVSCTRSTDIFINTPISLIFKFLSYLRVTTGDWWLPPHWISVWDIMEPALVRVVSLSLRSPIPVPFGILSMSGILVLQASLSAHGRESLPFLLHRGLWAEQWKRTHPGHHNEHAAWSHISLHRNKNHNQDTYYFVLVYKTLCW